MSQESSYLKIPSEFGQQIITKTDKIRLRNKELEVKKEADSILIPLVRQPNDDEIGVFKKIFPEIQYGETIFQEHKKEQKSLEEVLDGVLPPHLLASLPKALDIVGDIAIIELPPELKTFEKVVGEAVLKIHKNTKTVLAKAGAVGGTFRVRDFTFVAGEPRTNTIHKENGCQYQVDLAKAYFSPRLSFEHDRIASMVEKGETVVDLFAGVGPFSILVAKKHSSIRVFAVDINPEAFTLLERNLLLNRVQDKVVPVLGDARHIVHEKLSGTADRVIMNLPESAIEFVDVGCEAIRSEGGVVHFYDFVRHPDSMEAAKCRFTAEVEKAGKRVKCFQTTRAVRETAPYEQQVVLDAVVI